MLTFPEEVVLLLLDDEEGVLQIAPRIEQLRKMDLIGGEIAGAIADIERSVMQSMAHPLA